MVGGSDSYLAIIIESRSQGKGGQKINLFQAAFFKNNLALILQRSIFYHRGVSVYGSHSQTSLLSMSNPRNIVSQSHPTGRTHVAHQGSLVTQSPHVVVAYKQALGKLGKIRILQPVIEVGVIQVNDGKNPEIPSFLHFNPKRIIVSFHLLKIEIRRQEKLGVDNVLPAELDAPDYLARIDPAKPLLS